MTELEDRIAGVGQLGNVVRAMTGIASARARTANGQLAAVDNFAATLRDAWGCVQSPSDNTQRPETLPTRARLILFCAEQGFVGGFSEKVLTAVKAPGAVDLFLIGTRGAAIAEAQGITPIWSAALPARSASLPKFADHVLGQVMAKGRLLDLQVIYPVWDHGQMRVKKRVLYPLGRGDNGSGQGALTNLPTVQLARSLALDLMQAELTRAALHAFAAENQARMTEMSHASRQIDDELTRLQSQSRRARQEAITTEIIEISSGAGVTRR